MIASNDADGREVSDDRDRRAARQAVVPRPYAGDEGFEESDGETLPPGGERPDLARRGGLQGAAGRASDRAEFAAEGGSGSAFVLLARLAIAENLQGAMKRPVMDQFRCRQSAEDARQEKGERDEAGDGPAQRGDLVLRPPHRRMDQKSAIEATGQSPAASP